MWLGPFMKPSELGIGVGDNTWPLSLHSEMFASSSGISWNARSHTCQVESHKFVHTSAFLLVYCLLLPLPHTLVFRCAGFHGQPVSNASLSRLSCPDYGWEKEEIIFRKKKQVVWVNFNSQKKERKKITHLNIVQLSKELGASRGEGPCQVSIQACNLIPTSIL